MARKTGPRVKPSYKDKAQKRSQLAGQTFGQHYKDYLSREASWQTKRNAYESMKKSPGRRAIEFLIEAAAELSFTANDPIKRNDLLLEANTFIEKYERYISPRNPHIEINHALQVANLGLQTRLFIDNQHPSLEEKLTAQNTVTKALTSAHSQHLQHRPPVEAQVIKDYVGSASEAIGFILLNRAAVELISDPEWTPVTSLASQNRKENGARGSSGNWDASVIIDATRPFNPAHKIQFKWSATQKRYDDDVAVVPVKDTLRLTTENRLTLSELILEISGEEQGRSNSNNLIARTEQLLDAID